MKPLFTFISFIIVSAPKRIVVEEGIELIWTVFFGVFLKTIVPLVMSLGDTQDALRNTTEAQKNASITNRTGDLTDTGPGVKL